MDAYLAIISVRVVREYADRPVSDDSLQRILQAGRVTGSSVNRQEWRFYVVRSRAKLDELSETVFTPSNLTGCQVAIGLTTSAKGSFDVGRCAQDMILAAWSEGIGSSPNGARDSGRARHALGVPAEETLGTILSFGYPLHPTTPGEDDVDGILRRVKRKPLEELIVWVQ